jgi:hypothetical protein
MYNSIDLNFVFYVFCCMTPCCLWAVYVICKQGNDSQKAVQLLEKMSTSELDEITVKDICGGLMAWSQKIDPEFPQY